MTKPETILGAISHYSCLKSTLSPKAIVEEAVKEGYSSCGLADFDTMGGCVEFYQECKAAGIKPILGIRHSKDGSLYVAKNRAGYVELLNICYDINLKKDIAGHSQNVYKLTNDDAFIPAPRFTKDSAELFDILYATQKKQPLENVRTELAAFKHDYFGYSKAAAKLIDRTNGIGSEVEEYNILSKPVLPLFEGQENNTELLNRLCYEQLGREFPGRPEYKARLDEELGVLNEARLANYFLIIKDILDYARSEDYLVGPGRGSAAGSLVAYLLGITQLDPIAFNLLFSRFYNKGRNSENYTAMPDIDIDVPRRSRADITNYITRKYGEDRVCKIATYQTLMGRAAISAVTRARGTLSFAETKKMTKYIPDKAKISDELQLMKEAGDQPSVLLWSLQNEATFFGGYCELKKGKFSGPLAHDFKLAIALEGIKCALSEHAAGVVISRDHLKDCCPTIWNERNENMLAACEMEELDMIGLQKLDLLALSSLDRIECV